MTPYYEQDGVTLYHGDCREILPALDLAADLVLADPPYGTTAHPWDRWPAGWIQAASGAAAPTASLWCWLPNKVLLARAAEFAGWRYAQEAIWEKHNGTGFGGGRLLKVHEIVHHFYRGSWTDLTHEPPREAVHGPDKSVRRQNGSGNHRRPDQTWAYVDDGTRLTRSVIKAPSLRTTNRNPTEKPMRVLDLIVRGYAPPGGLVLDPTAGSGSALETALALGRRAVGVELREEQCEQVAKRLNQLGLVVA